MGIKDIVDVTFKQSTKLIADFLCVTINENHNIKKRLLSFTLACAMMFTTLTTAFAQNTTNQNLADPQANFKEVIEIDGENLLI